MAEHASHSPTGGVTPHLRVKGGKKAIDFYVKAFAATEFSRMPAQDGERLMHSHLGINGGSVMLADEFPEFGGDTSAPSGIVLHLAVDDADAWWARALAAGATVKMPLQDQFWGDRYGQLLDPFGHVWSIAAPVKVAKP